MADSIKNGPPVETRGVALDAHEKKVYPPERLYIIMIYNF
jgi:hypothetical protein